LTEAVLLPPHNPTQSVIKLLSFNPSWSAGIHPTDLSFANVHIPSAEYKLYDSDTKVQTIDQSG